MGLNEFAGYGAVSVTALLTGYIAAAYGLRPARFYPGVGNGLSDTAGRYWGRRSSRACRPGSVGVYRLWRDLGYAFGALLAGIVADALGVHAAIWSTAGLTCVSGCIVAIRMRETSSLV